MKDIDQMEDELTSEYGVSIQYKYVPPGQNSWFYYQKPIHH